MPESATADFGVGEAICALSIPFRLRGVSANAVAKKFPAR
jgi:hypothetical protein